MFQVSHSRASLFLNQLLAVPRRSYLTLLASPAAPSTSFWVWGNLTEPGAETGRRLGARATQGCPGRARHTQASLSPGV